MSRQANVPKFGNWEDNRNTPYTEYFDTARKVRSGDKPINPNDPQENPGDTRPAQAPTFKIVSDHGVPKVQNQHRTNREDVRAPSGSPLHPNAGDNYRRNHRTSQGSERSSVENSPHHPHQVKSANHAGLRSPVREKRVSSEGHGLGSSTPGRSKVRTPFRGDDPPEKGSVIPKFGDWDENNPSSADGYSDVFNRVREEKKNSAAKVPMISTDPDFSTMYAGDRKANNTSGCGCLSWFRK